MQRVLWILHQTFFVEERSIASYAAVAVCYHYTGRTFVDKTHLAIKNITANVGGFFYY